MDNYITLENWTVQEYLQTLYDYLKTNLYCSCMYNKKEGIYAQNK